MNHDKHRKRWCEVAAIGYAVQVNRLTRKGLNPYITSLLVHNADTNKTNLSRLVRVGGVNRSGDKTRQDSFVLNRPSFQFATVNE